MKITEDAIINGKIHINQPEKGFRVGIDALLLAAMVNNVNNEKILDLGAGVGSVALSVLFRLKSINMVSIESNLSYYNCSLQNKELNSFVNNRYQPLLGDIKDFKNLYNSFDIVLSNPPYYTKDSHNHSPEHLKMVANIETSANLQDFINYGFNYLKPKGLLYLINKADRLQEILTIASINKWGNITIYPIYSFENSEASRVIVCLKKLSKQKLVITKGITVHNKDGSYTKQAAAIIENGAGYFDIA